MVLPTVGLLMVLGSLIDGAMEGSIDAGKGLVQGFRLIQILTILLSFYTRL